MSRPLRKADEQQLQGAEPTSKATGECSRCSASIVFANHGKLALSTGWEWKIAPGGHVQPVCSRCVAASARKVRRT